VVPLASPPLAQGGENVLAAALYGVSPRTGIGRVKIAADVEHMARRRKLTIRF
jgi:hypothetical protein